jgi:hypothetical protein
VTYGVRPNKQLSIRVYRELRDEAKEIAEHQSYHELCGEAKETAEHQSEP